MVLRSNPRRLITYFLGSIAFMAVGIASVPGVIGWLCVSFFALCAVVFAVQLLPGAGYLRITGEGFVFCSLFRRSPLVRWPDVSDFRVATVPPSRHKLVVYDWSNAHAGRVRRVNRLLVGASDGLPDTYGMEPQALADLLNARRSRAIGAD
jgi:hypothetical protein